MKSLEGDRVRLRCPVGGNPKPTYSWQKNGELVQPFQRRFVIFRLLLRGGDNVGKRFRLARRSCSKTGNLYRFLHDKMHTNFYFLINRFIRFNFALLNLCAREHNKKRIPHLCPVWGV